MMHGPINIRLFSLYQTYDLTYIYIITFSNAPYKDDFVGMTNVLI